ncbi:protocatechuate 3,4-dioxygenase subunit alpha [Phaeobacter sp.]|uniref:protocatechuate 3,4-dioxygenase subunit alpha n=1 Tax=Phaeobacter sp. TaxID=1902409 RepID=UPI0025D3E529|nr:protocatechuate 3,4-dioxygenase subunit alpha [Phaeobacter sp.]
MQKSPFADPNAGPAPKLPETPSQTAGPYVHIGLAPHAAGCGFDQSTLGEKIVPATAEGTRIQIDGTIFDGAGDPVRDALIEVWHADPEGIYHTTPQTTTKQRYGWGRVVTDFETGSWQVKTIKPGPCPDPIGTPIAPHINLWIVARGINLGLHTRLYFDDETQANTADQTLLRIPDLDQRNTLLARYRGGAGTVSDPRRYRFDIHLQGAAETVFFDV